MNPSAQTSGQRRLPATTLLPLLLAAILLGIIAITTSYFVWLRADTATGPEEQAGALALPAPAALRVVA